MDEAEHLAGRAAVIVGGRIVAEGAPSTLAGRQAARATISFRPPPGIAVPAEFGGATRDGDGVVEFVPDDLTAALHRLTGWALDNGVDLDGLSVSRPSLEDVYLQLTEGAPE
jgi:ABC-2 type transport system ATP-binding protein